MTQNGGRVYLPPFLFRRALYGERSRKGHGSYRTYRTYETHSNYLPGTEASTR